MQINQTLSDLAEFDLRTMLAKLSIPVIVFHGRHDAGVPYGIGQYMAELAPKGQLVTFEESGHAPFIEEREKFSQALAEAVG